MNCGNITIIESESNFKKIDKTLIENIKIDCLTLGIYAKIVVLGKKWSLNIKGLSSHLNLSESKIRKSIALLEEEGYIKRTAVRNPKGQCVGWNYSVFPTSIPMEERSKAGKSSSSTDYPKNRQLGLPTTRFADNSENGGDIIYRLKETIDLNNKETKEEKEDTNVSKKADFSSKIKTNKQDAYKEIVDYWNEHTKSFPKVQKVTNKVKSAINARIKDGYSVDDIKKALLLCESLPDFYKGSNGWKADFHWIICNTKHNFDKILDGSLHTTNEQQREYKRVMNGEEYNPNEYRPTSNGGSVHWNEQTQCYYCFNPWDFYQFTDGYTNETRPDGAAVFCQGVKYTWSKEKKEWIQSR